MINIFPLFLLTAGYRRCMILGLMCIYGLSVSILDRIPYYEYHIGRIYFEYSALPGLRDERLLYGAGWITGRGRKLIFICGVENDPPSPEDGAIRVDQEVI